MTNTVKLTFSPTLDNVPFRMTALAGTLTALGLLGGCASTPPQQTAKVIYKNKTPARPQASGELLDAGSFDSLEDLLYATDMRAVEGDRLAILRYGDVWKRMTVGFKMNLGRYDPRIEAQRGWFASRQTYLNRLSARASRYLYYTVREAERRGIPTELALLPVIESSYDPAATSSAAAAGLWQFIPSTGKIYGLRQTDLYDGRRDVVESTRAAYEYLTSLYNQFGSWELALASYNAGPGRVQQAINRNAAAGLPTDYWSLRLPEETMNYVPRFMAVAQIVKNPQMYGAVLQPIANRPHFREVETPGSISLDDVSRLTGISRAELYALNPAHRGNYTDPYAPRRILIPNDVSQTVDNQIKRLSTVSGFGGYWTGGAAPPPTLNGGALATVRTAPPAMTSYSRTPAPTFTPSAPSGSATTVVNQGNSRQVIIRSTTMPVPEDDGGAASSQVSALPPASAASFNRQPTPVGSDALAQFASAAVVPSAPRLPVSVTPNPNIRPIAVEPPLTAAEKQAIISEVAPSVANPATLSAKVENQIVKTVTEPQPTAAEKQQVVAELEKINPKGSEIVDPLDGKIKLTAIQSSQSVAQQKGEDVKLTYAYPKAVAEAVKETGREVATRNSGKPVVETPTEVVVVPPDANKAPQGQRTSYVVRGGDTLQSIASRNGVSWRDIVKWNQIDANRPLYVGSRLYLYNVKPTPASRPERYTVQNGDSLTSVADQFDLNMRDLAEWNGLSVTSNLLRGQKLTLVEPKGQPRPVPRNDNRTEGRIESRADSRVTNSSESRTPVAVQSYTVKKGEHLTLLAERYGMTNAQLAALTPNLTPTTALQVGQRINVPRNMPQSTRIAAIATPVIDQPVVVAKFLKTKTYVVQAGDNLTQIAQRHDMSVSDLAALNNLTSVSGVHSGQRLKVAAIQGEKPTSYRVQNGDTLSSIAARFGLKQGYLASLNNLSVNSQVQRGQVLTLVESADSPALQELASAERAINNSKMLLGENDAVLTKAKKITREPIAPDDTDTAKGAYQGPTTTYTVKAGEHLTGLAGRYGMSVSEFAALNRLKTSTALRSGQRIVVPKRTTSYTVKEGDGLIRLAKKYGMTPQQLAELNDLRPDTDLRIGQTIMVPNL